jgi:hypothetical protein
MIYHSKQLKATHANGWLFLLTLIKGKNLGITEKNYIFAKIEKLIYNFKNIE